VNVTLFTDFSNTDSMFNLLCSKETQNSSSTNIVETGNHILSTGHLDMLLTSILPQASTLSKNNVGLAPIMTSVS